jgi:hypothetical protein
MGITFQHNRPHVCCINCVGSLLSLFQKSYLNNLVEIVVSWEGDTVGLYVDGTHCLHLQVSLER